MKVKNSMFGKDWDDLWSNFQKTMGSTSKMVGRAMKDGITSNNTVIQSTTNSTNVTTIKHGKSTVVVETINGVTSIRMNGKKYIAEDKK